MSDSDIRRLKQDMRWAARVKRRGLAQQQPDAAQGLAALAMTRLAPLLAAAAAPPIIAFYHAFADEMDAGPLARALAAQGCALALPVVVGKAKPLLFRRYAFGDPLAPGSQDIPEPLEAAPPLVPDWLLVPLLAFDRRGCRLGYGGGYYDASLRALRQAGGRILAIGTAYAGQEMPHIPAGPQDEPLDAIATEQDFIAAGGA